MCDQSPCSTDRPIDFRICSFKNKMLVKHVFVYEFTPGRLDITVILLCQKDLDSSFLTQAAHAVNP